MSARVMPTMPAWGMNAEITSSLLNQISAYANFWTSPPMFAMYQGAVQPVPTAVYTQIAMDTVTGVIGWDTDSGRSSVTPYSYTIPVGMAGRWRFTWKVGWAVNATGSRLSALYQNGVAVLGSQVTQQALTTASRTTDVGISSKTVACSVGDVMSVWGFQDSGANLNTDTGSGASFFEGELRSLASP